MTASLLDATASLPLATSGTNWEIVFIVAIVASIILAVGWLATR